jgi:hypothetical protein
VTVRQDFTVDAGRDYGVTVAITEDDNETALDLTDCDLAWAVSRAPGQTALISKTSADADEIEITSAAEGEATIYLVPADTEDFGGLTCEHELVVTDAAGAESTVLRGLITINKSLIN